MAWEKFFVTISNRYPKSKLYLLRNSPQEPDVYDELVLEIPANSTGRADVDATLGNLILVAPDKCCQIQMHPDSFVVEIYSITKELNSQRSEIEGKDLRANRLTHTHGSAGVDGKKLLEIYNHSQLGFVVACFSPALKQLRIVHKAQPMDYAHVSIPEQHPSNVIYCLSYVPKREASASAHLQEYPCLSAHESLYYENREFSSKNIALKFISPEEDLWRQAWRPVLYQTGAGLQRPAFYTKGGCLQGPLQNQNYSHKNLQVPKMIPSVWANLPSEIFPLILARLPLVSKLRATLVSKSWKEMLRNIPRAFADELWIVFRPYKNPCQIRRDLDYHGLGVNPPLFENRVWCSSSGFLFKFPFEAGSPCPNPQGFPGYLDRGTRDYECIDLDELLQAQLTIEFESGLLYTTKLKTVEFSRCGAIPLRNPRNVWLEFEGPWCGYVNLQFLDLYVWNKKIVLVGALMRQSTLVWLRIWNLEELDCGVKHWVEIAILDSKHEMWKTLMEANLDSIHIEANVCGCFVVVTCWIRQSNSRSPCAKPPILFHLSKRYWRILDTGSFLHYVYNFTYKPKFMYM